MTRSDRNRLSETNTVVRITNHVRKPASKLKVTNNKGATQNKAIVDTKNKIENDTVATTSKQSKETKSRNTTPKPVEARSTRSTTGSALTTYPVLATSKKTDDGNNKKEKVSRVTGQKTKRTNDTTTKDGNPQKKKKEDMDSTQKEPQRELNIFDDPLNYISNSEDEEYEVESIVSHKVYKSKVINYVIKWKGWDHKYNTTEKATTIHADVPDICREYWSKFDSNQILSNVAEFTKQNSVYNQVDDANLEYRKKTYSDKHIRPRMAVHGFTFNSKWPNSSTNWEADLKKIASVLPSVLDERLLFGYIEWVNGQRTVHFINDLHKHCPEKLISYYEERLRIF